jgi:hypothetical protein
MSRLSTATPSLPNLHRASYSHDADLSLMRDDGIVVQASTGTTSYSDHPARGW